MIENAATFIGITLIFMGGCAFMSGQALAATWRPLWQCFPYALGLAAASRFIAYALFKGTLLSIPFFVTDWLALTAMILAAYRMTQAKRMVRQYPWIYERTGLFAWREKGQ